MSTGRRFGLASLSMLVAQCAPAAARPTAPVVAPAASATTPAPTTTQTAAANSAPVIDPQSCVDPEAAREAIESQQHEKWSETVDARVDQVLSSNPCAVSDKAAEAPQLAFAILFDEHGKQRSLAVEWSTFTTCGAVECMRSALAGVQAPEMQGHSRIYTARLEFPPNSIARRSTDSTEPPISRRGPCADTKSVVPSMRVSGRLPPPQIQKIVRDRFGDFRKCYEAGLGRNPNLEGRVSTRFVIERDGKVSKSRVMDNTLPDCEVAHCVANVFTTLTFPPPEAGIVTVVYPIMLAPG